MVLTDKSCERESHKSLLLYDRANTVCMLTYNLYVLHTNIGVDIPMTAKYYHNLWVFMTIPYYGLTVN